MPMHRWIAFLRAINVGGHVVKMDRLRALFEEMGFEGVATFIASGNVIFDSPEGDARALEKRIEAHLRRALGYEVGTYLRSTAEVAEIAAYQPFAREEMERPGGSLYVTFMQSAPPAGAAERLAALCTETDHFHLNGREMWWLCHTRMSDSTVTGPQLAKAVSLPGTNRNVTTVRKLAAKYPPQ